MSIPNLGQTVRASIAKAKDVALRGADASFPSGAGAVRTQVDAGPVRKPDPPTAILREGGGAAGEALRSAAAQRGGVTATVVAALGGNRYVVEVDGKQTAVVLETPATADQRALTPGAEVRLITGRDAAAAALQGARAAADDPQFSDVAKLIASVARDDDAAAPGRGAMQPARLAVPAVPIAGNGFEPAQVAAVLRQAVDTSGLFYEAHLAEWIAGRRSLESVRREPQAQLTRPVLDAEGRPVDPGMQVQREANALVREQIHALQAQQFAWQCDLWRDQPGFLEIGRDPAPADTPPQSQTWRARIAVDLPNLGPVEIRMAITGDDIGVTFGADADASRRLLDGALASLGDSLEARGMRPRVATTRPNPRSGDGEAA
jgi:hypothetical protein